MFRFLIAVALFTSTMASSSACLFPWYPAYRTAYYGWGAPVAYAPASYGYAGYRSCGYGPACGTACFAGYTGCSTSAYYAPAVCGTCGCTACGCSTVGCGVSGCSSVGCGTFGCGTVGCASSDCLPSGVRKEPTPDSANDRNDPGSNYERELDRNRKFRGGGLGEENPADPMDEFNRPGSGGATGSGGTPGSDTNSSNQWSPNSRGGSNAPMFGTEGDEEFTPRTFGSGGANRPTGDGTGPGAGDGTGQGIENGTGQESGTEGGIQDQTGQRTFKPPTTHPVDEDGNPTTNETSETGTESDSTEFLSPPNTNSEHAAIPRSIVSNRNIRSSHHEVRGMQRLARRRMNRHNTQVSSSRNEQQTTRWISVPMPEGRARL